MALADIVEAIAASPKLAGVAVHLGVEFNPQHGAPPRVVFVPTSITWGSRAPPQGMLTRSKGTLQTTLRAHIWAAAAEDSLETSPNMRAAERLMNSVIWAVDSVAKGSFAVVGGEWDQDPGVLQLGRHIILDFRFDVPVTETAVMPAAPPTTTTVVVSNVDPLTGDIIQ